MHQDKSYDRKSLKITQANIKDIFLMIKKKNCFQLEEA